MTNSDAPDENIVILPGAFSYSLPDYFLPANLSDFQGKFIRNPLKIRCFMYNSL